MGFAIAGFLVLSHAAAFVCGMVYKAKVLAEKETLKKRAETFIGHI